MYILSLLSFNGNLTFDGLLGFLGAVIGVFITYIVATKQIRASEKPFVEYSVASKKIRNIGAKSAINVNIFKIFLDINKRSKLHDIIFGIIDKCFPRHRLKIYGFVNRVIDPIFPAYKYADITLEKSVVTSLLKTNFCFKSIRHYIVFVSRMLKEVDRIIIESESNEPIILFDIDDKVLNEHRNIIKFAFQHICNIMTSDWFEISEGYEVITFMEFFKKYKQLIPSFILQKFLKQKELSNDYFVLTAITNYIYDSNNHVILKEYISVYKSVCEVLIGKLNEYKHEGILAVENGNFFYLLNDFYYFPGKNEIFRSILRANFQDEISQLQGKKTRSSELSGQSYYQWGESFDHFLEMVLRKKVIDNNFNFDGLTSGDRILKSIEIGTDVETRL